MNEMKNSKHESHSHGLTFFPHSRSFPQTKPCPATDKEFRAILSEGAISRPLSPATAPNQMKYEKRNMKPKYEHDHRRPRHGGTAVSCGSIPSTALTSAPNRAYPHLTAVICK
jgi:hypothetical protein